MANTSLNSIETIKSYFAAHNGVQLQNRFKVYITGLPSAISTSNPELQAEQVIVGPRSLSTVRDNLIGLGGGRFVPRSQDVLSGGFGLQIVFPITNDNHILKLFNDWFNYFYRGPQTASLDGRPATILQYYDTAVRPVTLQLDILDPNSGINSSMFFYEVFPVETQPMEFNMGLVDKYLKYPVTFAFREYMHKFN